MRINFCLILSLLYHEPEQETKPKPASISSSSWPVWCDRRPLQSFPHHFHVWVRIGFVFVILLWCHSDAHVRMYGGTWLRTQYTPTIIYKGKNLDRLQTFGSHILSSLLVAFVASTRIWHNQFFLTSVVPHQSWFSSRSEPWKSEKGTRSER